MNFPSSQEFTKQEYDIINLIRTVDWGTVEIKIKDSKAWLVSIKKDVQL